MRTESDPVPWNYEVIVSGLLKPTDFVLDIGTAGGEKLTSFMSHCDKAVGIDVDPKRIATARKKLPGTLKPKVSYEAMDSISLKFSGESFDVVLSRHAPVSVGEIERVLKKGGLFITQQVGQNNMGNILVEFGVSGVQYAHRNSLEELQEELIAHRLKIVDKREYDVDFYVKDIESLLFWLKSLRFPRDFSVEKYWREIDEIVKKYTTSKGIKTNEHRWILVAQRN